MKCVWPRPSGAAISWLRRRIGNVLNYALEGYEIMYGCLLGVGDVSDHFALIVSIFVKHLELSVGHRLDQQLVIEKIF